MTDAVSRSLVAPVAEVVPRRLLQFLLEVA